MNYAPLPQKRLVIDGLTLDVRSRVTAGAPSVILVHGIGVSGVYYTPLAHTLSQHYSVHVPDLPGYGKTPKPARPLSIPELARILRTYIHEAKIERPILVGHSMGCQIVAHAWQQEPEICSKLILLGPTANPRERTLFMQGLRLAQDILHEPLTANVIVFRDYLRMGVPRYLRTAHNMVDDHLEETLAGCNIPVLLVRGERDKIVPRDWLNQLASVIPASQTFEFPGQPHIVQYQHPERLAAVCQEFIDS